MLNRIELNDKTYEELLAEAYAQIPLYSEEWTNFNLSDPGITTLQNLTAFQILQQENISTVTEEVRRALLRLVGYTAQENTPATLLAERPSFPLPMHYSLLTGSLPFETIETVAPVDWSLAAVYSGEEDVYRDITRLLDPHSNAAADVFGRHPKVGNALYCILEGSPAPGSVLEFWAQVPSDPRRTPFDPTVDTPVFAETQWQYFTAEGWTDLLAADRTRDFLQSGSITLTLGDAPPVLFPEPEIYGKALRCLLRTHDYDRAPRLQALSAPLFPLRQQQTIAYSHCFSGTEPLRLESSLAAQGNLFVYVREEPDGDYLLYTESPSVAREGRYYRRTLLENGVAVHFDRAVFGHAPDSGADAVLLCCYDNDSLHHRALGPVYGYEDQRIDLDLVRDLVADQFSVLAELPAFDGEPHRYRRILPNGTDPDELCYRVCSEEGQLHIVHPAYDTTYQLFLCDCVTTQGARGNLRPATTLEHLGGYDGQTVEQRFFAPSPGFGGVSYESAEQLRRRFSADMRRIRTAVTAADYAFLVKTTPGLCIHKVKAIVFPKENLVKVVVKPYTEEVRPTLSPLYLRQLEAHLEQCRMLTTRVELLSPSYVRIDISLRALIKPHVADAAGEIEALLRQTLDYVSGDQPFGTWVRFGTIYDALCRLPCIVRVDSLRLLPADRSALRVSASDLKLDEQTLCYPGDIRLELHPFTEQR